MRILNPQSMTNDHPLQKKSSRAIAITSFQDNFDILILNESMSRIRFDPINGVCIQMII